MKIAVLSDIHGNIEAFRAVMADIEQQGVDDIVSLGDIVGYGPAPDACIELMRERGIKSVAGNHDLGIINPRKRLWFNPSSRKALDVTKNLVSEDGQNYLRTLSTCMRAGNYHFVHGMPPDDAFEYLFATDDDEIKAYFEKDTARIFFVGHTHMREIVGYDGEKVERIVPGEGVTKLAAESRYFINVGAVGQPRDDDQKAKYVLFDEAAYSVEFRFVPYDVEKTAQEMLRLGFPERYAERLRMGS
jgi:predicted phosphodiesterase